jgi:hypothetical protein
LYWKSEAGLHHFRLWPVVTLRAAPQAALWLIAPVVAIGEPGRFNEQILPSRRLNKKGHPLGLIKLSGD